MTEEAELQAKIAAISGKINQHKQQQQQHPPSAQYSPPHHPYGSPRGRGRGHGQHRWTPYGRGGRGGRGGYPPSQHRTLVLNGTSTPPKQTNATAESVNVDNSPAPQPHATPDNFVSSHAPGRNQLMNQNTFDREQKQLFELKQQARTAKKQEVNREERSRLMQHTSTHDNREIVVQGLRFQLRDDGSKLIRISDSTGKETPKKVRIADVDFFRTKHGNLVRANAVKTLRNQKEKPQCQQFTKHGNCPFGISCHFAHDPQKVAICPAFLKNTCTAGDDCDLSHEISYSRVPACIHFARGNCTNDACRYSHVHVNPSSPVCRPFALLGYCGNSDCEKRHVFECPDYANHGSCANRSCPLPHPDRASALRKKAAKQAKTGSEDESDVSSDEDEQENDVGFEDIDSDEADDVIMTDSKDGGHEMSQQQDYIAFS